MTQERPQPPDEELVAAALRGDSDRFGDLVARYQHRVVNYLFRLLRNLDEAHDLAQDVFLKIYRALDRFDARYRFSTWLFRVAQNTAIDRLRKRRFAVVSMQRDGDDGRGPHEWDFPSSETGPYADLRNRERGEAIQASIDALPWEYRELIVLRHFAELSYEEIATLKEMPLGTVKNKLFRARQILKRELSDYLTD